MPRTMKLTKRQEEVLGVIKGYIREHGWPPAIRDIRDILEIGSASGVLRHLNALEAKGRIERGKHPRQIRVIK